MSASPELDRYIENLDTLIRKLSPAEHRFKIESREAACPLDVSIEATPPSRSAIFFSTASQVGFAIREYMYSVGLSKRAAT